MSKNQGATITGSRNLDNLVSINEIPYPTLEDDMIILRTVANAVNPTDWKHIFPEDFAKHLTLEAFKKLGLGVRSLENVFGAVGGSIGYFVGKNATYAQKGAVVGSDVSGIVEEVGKKVTKVKKGDFIGASLHGGMTKNGGFSKYVLVSENSAVKFSHLLQSSVEPGQHPGAKITSFEAAASVPLGLKTVALSFHCHLGIPPHQSQNKEDYLLIWGGATATGILAIQIAKKVYGIKVITTASKKHHEALLSLGADKAFDYHDKDVIEQLKTAGQGKIKYALDCVSNVETFQSVYDATEGSSDVCLDNLLFLNAKLINTRKNHQAKFVSTNAYLVDGRRHFGKKASKELLDQYLDFWHNYLPPIVEQLQTAPLKVLQPGLESANEGLRLLIENKVSGEKVVFRRE